MFRLPVLAAVGLFASLSLFLACGPSGSDPDPGPQQPDAGEAADAAVPSTCSEVGLQEADLDSYQALLECLQLGQVSAKTKREAIDAFVAVVESRGGFPIVTPDRVVFVYVLSATYDAEDDKLAGEDFDPARRGEPLQVAGDFNEWKGAAMAHAGEGLYHLQLPLVVGAERWGYKFVAKDGSGGDVLFSDPLSRRFAYDSYGRLSLVKGGSQKGHLEWIRSVNATRLGVSRPVYLYVPPGYEQESDRYPVLYMHDGNSVFDPNQPRSAETTWDVDRIADAEIAAGRVRKFLVVGIPNNDNRFAEYTHVQDNPAQIGRTVGGSADDYADFILSDLRPVVEARYRTLPGAENRAIMGSSLGGLISYYVGLKHPEAFKYGGGRSSTFGWGKLGSLGNPTVIELYAGTSGLASRGQVFYLDSGGGPNGQGNCSTVGTDNYCETLEMQRTLEGLGVKTYPLDTDAERIEPAGVNIFHYWEPGAEHMESVWSGRVFRPLRLFFRP